MSSMKNIFAAIAVSLLVSKANAGVVLTDSFENGIGNWVATFPSCSGTGTESLGTTAHTGSKSLLINGGGGFCNHVFANNTAILNARPQAYVKFWINHNTASPSLHTTFLAMTDANDGYKQLRLGAQNGNLAWNRESDDSTCPSQSPTGIATSVSIPINTWTCIEFMVDTANGYLDAWVNDVEVPGLHAQNKVADIDQAWYASKPSWIPNPIDLKLGWESYASDSDSIFYDDVVISNSRIGCSGSVATSSVTITTTTKSTTTTTTVASTTTKSTTTTTTVASPTIKSATTTTTVASPTSTTTIKPTSTTTSTKSISTVNHDNHNHNHHQNDNYFKYNSEQYKLHSQVWPAVQYAVNLVHRVHIAMTWRKAQLLINFKEGTIRQLFFNGVRTWKPSNASASNAAIHWQSEYFEFSPINFINELVRGLRANDKNKEKYVSTCLNQIRQQITKSDPDLKAVAVAKLCYLHMMGYDMTWASFHVLEVMSSPKIANKRGYAASAQSFRQDTSVLMLATNQLKKVEYLLTEINEAALHGLGHFVTHDLGRDILPDLTRLLNHSRPYIRKRTILVIYRVFLKYPEALRTTFPQVRSKLDDPDPSVVSTAVNVICELARKNPKSYLPLAPALYGLLTNSSNNWMLIKIVKLFAALTPLEPRLVKKLIPPLTNLIQTSSAMSVLYECIQTSIIGGLIGSETAENDEKPTTEASANLARLCVEKLRLFVEDQDQNLKYLGLFVLLKLQPLYPRAVLVYKETILRTLSDPDVSVRTRALELVSGMVTPKNLIDIVRQLLRHVNIIDPTAPEQPNMALELTLESSYVKNVISRVIEICYFDTFSKIRNFEWYLNILKSLASKATGEVAKQCGSQLQEVAIRVQEVRNLALEIAVFLLGEENEEVKGGCAWICGEFSDLLENPKLALDNLLLKKSSRAAQPHILCAKITASLKIIVNHKSFVQANKDEIVSAVDKLMSFPDVEVAERAVEASKLLRLIFQMNDVSRTESTPIELFELQKNFNPMISEMKKLWEGALKPVSDLAQKHVQLPTGLNLDDPIYEEEPEEEEIEDIIMIEKFPILKVVNNESEEAKKRKQDRLARQKQDPYYIRDPVQDAVEKFNDEVLDSIPVIALTSDDIKEINNKSKKIKNPQQPTKSYTVNRDQEMPEGVTISQTQEVESEKELDPDTYAVLSVDLTVDPTSAVEIPEVPDKKKKKKKSKSGEIEKKSKSKKDTSTKNKANLKKVKKPIAEVIPLELHSSTGQPLPTHFKQIYSDDYMTVYSTWKRLEESIYDDGSYLPLNITLKMIPSPRTSALEFLFESEIPEIAKLSDKEHHVNENADNTTRSTLQITLPTLIYFTPLSTLTINPQTFATTLQSTSLNGAQLISAASKFQCPSVNQQRFIVYLVENVLHMKVVEIIGNSASFWTECVGKGWVAGLLRLNGTSGQIEVKGVTDDIVAAVISVLEEWIAEGCLFTE
ncbi:hypothetical protein HK096_007255 [Nowakowskiella sp. JEL0078]|nr:hypothetical protein HK096_007255 [Nowakowskiella sp. JEL0078]